MDAVAAVAKIEKEVVGRWIIRDTRPNAEAIVNSPEDEGMELRVVMIAQVR